MREHLPDLPIIILTARSETRSVVAGLDRGADDYIAKPFDSAVLLARIAAVLRVRATGGQRSNDQEATTASSSPS